MISLLTVLIYSAKYCISRVIKLAGILLPCLARREMGYSVIYHAGWVEEIVPRNNPAR